MTRIVTKEQMGVFYDNPPTSKNSKPPTMLTESTFQTPFTNNFLKYFLDFCTAGCPLNSIPDAFTKLKIKESFNPELEWIHTHAEASFNDYFENNHQRKEKGIPPWVGRIAERSEAWAYFAVIIWYSNMTGVVISITLDPMIQSMERHSLSFADVVKILTNTMNFSGSASLAQWLVYKNFRGAVAPDREHSPTRLLEDLGLEFIRPKKN